MFAARNAFFTGSILEVITFSIGAAGSFTGTDGGTTTATFRGVTITATGGKAGLPNSTTAAVGGTGSGGDGASTGGSGLARSGSSVGCGGGGAIGGANATEPTTVTHGGNGAQSVDVSGLRTAIEGAGQSWTAPGVGQNAPFPNGTTTATGFGCGGGGSLTVSGGLDGSAGRLGGGGGGGRIAGGSGGGGCVVMQFTVGGSPQYVVRPFGTSWSVPAGTTAVKIWVVGGGGGGSAMADTTNAAGGGGAGGVAYRTWTL